MPLQPHCKQAIARQLPQNLRIAWQKRHITCVINVTNKGLWQLGLLQKDRAIDILMLLLGNQYCPYWAFPPFDLGRSRSRTATFFAQSTSRLHKSRPQKSHASKSHARTNQTPAKVTPRTKSPAGRPAHVSRQPTARFCTRSAHRNQSAASISPISKSTLSYIKGTAKEGNTTSNRADITDSHPHTNEKAATAYSAASAIGKRVEVTSAT